MRAKPVQVVEVGEAAGQRLDNFLIARLKGVPKSRIYRMVRGGEVRVNGGRAKAGQRLAATDRVRIPPHTGADASEPTADHGLAVAVQGALLHEDEDLIVVDKPSGIAVHGGSGVRAGLVETLRARQPTGWLELAHRIDRDTSGVLVLAKNRRTLLAWHEAFRAGRVRKRYDAVVEGEWPAALRTVRSPLRRLTLAGGERRMRVAADGQSARTDFEVVARSEGATHVRAFPKTGRTHQIRVHAASSGHPILGDDKYARGKARSGRLLLHASRLRVEIDGVALDFRAPLPAAFGGFAAAS
ncbi:MAG: RluA family pseudouridine synthase [Gammaproteobacteria bacterium]|nr:RluA family pseudouridine synthase [Gammaproteobacteria bacterium]